MNDLDLGRLFRALVFAADKHQTQRRKNAAASPYINHPIAVASVLATEVAVVDEVTILAAVLHDTIEDTETTPEELGRLFGADVLAVVAEVTDDKTFPKEVRKQLQIAHAAGASPKAKLLKIADKICNVRDVTSDPPADWSTERRREYLDWSERVVAGCRGVDATLDAVFDAALAAGRLKVGADEAPEDTARDAHPDARWAVVYTDTFDRDAEPRVEVEGEGVVAGLKELWARHLFESVSASGVGGFSRFHLEWPGRGIMISGDSEGARRLREWMFGTKRTRHKGYAAEADVELLDRVAAVHAERLEQPSPAEHILATARDSTDRAEFIARLG